MSVLASIGRFEGPEFWTQRKGANADCCSLANGMVVPGDSETAKNVYSL